MAYLIQGGDDAFNAMLYGEHHVGTVNYLAEQRSKVRNYLSEAGHRFRERAENIIQRFNYSDAMRLTRAVNRAMNNAWNLDAITRLNDIGQLQHAKPNMQRWIMAEPSLRVMYHQQKCDGYSDSYVDSQPNVVGEAHYEYRRATNGVFFGKQDSKEPLCAVTYYESLRPNERELLFDEQVDILSTWELARKLILEGKEDPTSVFNSML